MLSSLARGVAFLLAAETCYAVAPHGGHGAPAEAYRHQTPYWPHSYLNTSADCSTAGTTPSARVRIATGGSSGTVNALSATLKYWWPSRASQPASTVSILFDPDTDKSTGWTLLPASTTLDINYAVTSEVCSPPTVTITYSDLTFTPTNCDARFPQVAASTTAVYLNAFKTPTTTAGYNTPIPDLQVSSPSAYATIGRTTIASGTAFVQFTKYEVVKCSSSRCQTATYKLDSPYVFPYDGPNPAKAKDVKAIVTGKLDPAFPAYINRTSLEVGEWSSPPTVIVVINLVLVAVAVLAATIEAPQSTLIVPTPTLPKGFTLVPPAPITTPPNAGPVYTARIEQTQTFLLLPGPPEPPRTTATKEGAVITVPPAATTCSSDCPAPAQDVIVGGTTLSPTSLPYYIADGKTIRIGEGASISDCTVSAAAAGTLLQICGQQTSTILAPGAGVFTAGGVAITATSGSGYVAPGHTLVPGGPGMTIGGLPVSMASGKGGLQIGKATATVTGTATITASGSSTTDAPPAATTTNAAHSDSLMSTTLALSACGILGWLWVIG